MANFFQWNGDATTGAGYVVFTGSATVVISGNITTGSIAKGTIITVITATLTATLTTDTTYTSAETSIIGFSSIFVQTTLGTGARTATNISGAFSSGGTMYAVFDKDTSAQMTTGSISSSRTQRFIGLTDYVGFNTTFSAGATAGSSFSVTIQPLNL